MVHECDVYPSGMAYFERFEIYFEGVTEQNGGSFWLFNFEGEEKRFGLMEVTREVGEYLTF